MGLAAYRSTHPTIGLGYLLRADDCHLTEIVMEKSPILVARMSFDLVECVPELKPALDEHLIDNFGEVLNHVFWSDVVRFLIGLSSGLDQEKPKNSDDVARRIVDFCERAITSDDIGVQEVIHLSFLGNLNRKDIEVLYPLFGPNLRREVEHYKDKATFLGCAMGWIIRLIRKPVFSKDVKRLG